MPNHQIICGDALDVLRTLQENSVHCVVTSPPYWKLRDYGIAGQLGLESTVDEYVAKMVTIFAEVRRVLRKDGVLFLNLGDSYNTSPVGHHSVESLLKSSTAKVGNLHESNLRASKTRTIIRDGHYKPKDLLGIPWRIAFALQADGWYLRQDIIWHKPNPLPESVTDRCTKSHEYIFLLTKSARYYYDADAIRESSTNHKRNRHSVWTFATQSYKGDHFATFPLKLPELCIQAGTSDHGCCPLCGAPWQRLVQDTPDYAALKASKPWIGGHSVGSTSLTQGYAGNKQTSASKSQITIGWQPNCPCQGNVPIPCTVLDPFSGVSTTGIVALRLGRDYLGIELNPAYVEMSQQRIQDDAPLWNTCEETALCASPS